MASGGMKPTNCNEGSSLTLGLSAQKKVVLTLAAYLCYILSGMAVTLNGTCLIDLALLTDSTVGKLSWMFSAAAGGGLIGAALVPLVARWWSLWAPAGVAMLAIGIIMLILPWCTMAEVIIGIMAIFGIGRTFVDSAFTHGVVNIWGKDNAPWMLGLACMNGVGSMLAPIIAKPFLSSTSDQNGQTESQYNASLSMQNKTETILLNHTNIPIAENKINYQELASSNMWNDLQLITTSNAEGQGNGTLGFKELEILLPNDQESMKVHFAYLIVSGLCILSALVLITVGLIHRYKWGFGPSTRCSENDHGAKKTVTPIPRKYSISIFASLCCLLFSYMMIETMLLMYLFTFAVHQCNWSKDTSAILVFVVVLSFTLTRGIWAFLGRCVKLSISFLGFSLLAIASSVVLSLCYNLHPIVVWTCAIGIGVGAAPIYATAISIYSTFQPVTPLVVGLTQVPITLSGIAVPSIFGVLYSKFGSVLFLYVTSIGSILILLNFFALSIFGRLIIKYNKALYMACPT